MIYIHSTRLNLVSSFDMKLCLYNFIYQHCRESTRENS